MFFYSVFLLVCLLDFIVFFIGFYSVLNSVLLDFIVFLLGF